MTKPLPATQFKSTEDVKSAFSINGLVEIGESSYVQVIKHSVITRDNEDSPVSVQVGTLIGDTIFVDTEVANLANEILKLLEKFFESGDHNGLVALDLFLIDGEGYRIHGIPDEDMADDEEDEDHEAEPFELNNLSLPSLVEEFRKITRMS